MNKKNKGYQTRLELQVLLSIESVLDHEHPKATEGLQDYLKRKAQRIVVKFLNRVQKEEEIVKSQAKRLAGGRVQKKDDKPISTIANKPKRKIRVKTPISKKAGVKSKRR